MRHSTAGKRKLRRQELAVRAVLATKGHTVRAHSDYIKASISWNRQKLEEFKRALAGADDRMDKCFEFEGHAFLVTYARDLVEYLEGSLANEDDM
jgi:hypothetical protein